MLANSRHLEGKAGTAVVQCMLLSITAIFYGLSYIAGVDLPLFFQIAFETCFASDGVFIVSRSFTALQALLRPQVISADCSDVEDSNNEIYGALSNDLDEVELNLCRKELGVNSSSEDDDSNSPNQVQVIEKD